MIITRILPPNEINRKHGYSIGMLYKLNHALIHSYFLTDE